MSDPFIRDVPEWTKALGEMDAPTHNYFQVLGFRFEDPHEGALIGYERAPHPVLGWLLIWPVRALFRLSEASLNLSGYRDTGEEGYDERRFVETGSGFLRWGHRLDGVRSLWSLREPIYDEARVAANKARIAEERAKRPPMQWGMADAAKDLERKVMSGEDLA